MNHTTRPDDDTKRRTRYQAEFAIRHSDLPFATRHLLNVMWQLADWDTGVLRRSQARLAELTGLKLATVKKHLLIARDGGWVDWEGKSNVVTTYRLIGSPRDGHQVALSDEKGHQVALVRSPGSPDSISNQSKEEPLGSSYSKDPKAAAPDGQPTIPAMTGKPDGGIEGTCLVCHGDMIFAAHSASQKTVYYCLRCDPHYEVLYHAAERDYWTWLYTTDRPKWDENAPKSMRPSIPSRSGEVAMRRDLDTIRKMGCDCGYELEYGDVFSLGEISSQCAVHTTPRRSGEVR